MSFTFDEIARYERQAMLPGWGAEGQERLKAATVEVRGRGLAAELCIRYLAAAGVGRLVVEAFADEARAANPFVAVEELGARGILPHPGQIPGQPDPDPPEPWDPEHPDRPAPEAPLPTEPEPDEPAVARVLRGGGGEATPIVAADDRASTGSALAVEALKALLGAPHARRAGLVVDAAEADAG